jgi:putative DNA-invertase from lambdoid prophage Rac
MKTYSTTAKGTKHSTPTGELIFGVLAAVAQFELSLIRERTKAGLRKAVAIGKILGRPISAAGPSASALWRRAKAASGK